jgi:hypothetical protein
VENAIREIIPKDEVKLVLDNIGLPNRTYAMAFGDSATTGMADGEILVSLDHHRSKSRRLTSPNCGENCRGGFRN